MAALALVIVLFGSVTIAQLPTTKDLTLAADYPQEAVVIEQQICRETFESSGAATKERTGRLRIQSDAGVQQFGLLNFPYASGTESFEIVYVRVRKPDGSVQETPQDNVQDMPAQITREAPFYSDLHEKHLAVKGLSAGDVLEYRTVERTTKPLAPGQFWTSYQFTRDQIVLDEQLEIRVPRQRQVNFKSTEVEPTTSEAGEYRIYTWRSKNLRHKDEKNNTRETIEQLWQLGRGRLPGPDVLMSSFATWDEVGRWYGGLQEERVKPTPEIKAKAIELTRNAPDDDAKVKALYAFVSTHFRYIGVAFGIGRYQPHSAAAVLENQYGDCKDKHTLLAALLAAAGIPAYPALISTTHEVEAAVPSPGQFDHVITVVPRKHGAVWLDSTTEVGPYQYLFSGLRGKHALAIWSDQPPALISTPNTLPYPSLQTFNITAKLSDAGTLEGQADFSARGDIEYLLRTGFRTVPASRWKELLQRISFGFGFGGEVSDVIASSPENTDEPFHMAWKYTRKQYGDWENHRILAPEPMINLPTPSDEEQLPLGPSWLGAPTEIRFTSEVELPLGYQPALPAAVHLKWDFAQFDATYGYKAGKLVSERHLKIMMPEVPASERQQLKELAKTLQEDYGRFIPLVNRSEPVRVEIAQIPKPAALNSLSNLPDSPDAEATRLEREAREAMGQHDVQGAISSLYRAVAADPKFTRAWVMLGGVLLMQKQTDAGMEAFHKAMAADPAQTAISKALGWSLMAIYRFEDAVPVWQQYMKAQPNDIDGPMNLAQCLSQLGKYSDAAATYEAAAKINSDHPVLYAKIGSAYLSAGERNKAVEAFSKLGEVDAQGQYLNDAAYQMASADLALPMALAYAKRAVRKAEEDSQQITLENLSRNDLDRTFALAADWDTLGWVYERMSNFSDADRYLTASWKLSEDGVVAGHLCHMYRRMHETAKAIQMCRVAVFRLPLSPQIGQVEYKTELEAAKENLKFLTARATSEKTADVTGPASEFVMRERTFRLPRFLSGTQSAEFFVLLQSDANGKTFKVADVKFISGSDKLKPYGKQLRTINFNVSAPDDVPARFLRRGILGCYEYTGCSFVLLDPETVHSVD